MFSLFFLGACSAFAQVGVGTQNPQTALHVAGVNAAASGTAPGALAAGDGVIVTRVTTDLSGGAVTTGCSAATQGALVYSTHATGTGYYTCNGASWEPLSSGGGGDLSVTTVSAAYTVLVADEIIEYNGAGAVDFILPTTAPIGKIFYILSSGTGTVSFAAVVTTSSNTLPSGTGSAYIHLGGGRYSSLYGGF